MESQHQIFEIRSDAIINPDNGYGVPSDQRYANSDVSSLSSPELAEGATASSASENQIMPSDIYPSSTDPDVPTHYSILNSGAMYGAGDGGDGPCDKPVIIPISSSPAQVQTPAILTTNSKRSYTVQFKLNVLDWYYKNGENKKMTAKMFEVDRKRIRDWLQDESRLRSDPTPERTRKKRSGCLPQYREIETEVYQWYIAQKDRGWKPKNSEIRAKGLELAPQFGFQESFKASASWLCNWKRRNRISDVLEEGHGGNEEEDNILNVPVNLEVELNELGRVSERFDVNMDCVVQTIGSGNGMNQYAAISGGVHSNRSDYEGGPGVRGQLDEPEDEEEEDDEDEDEDEGLMAHNIEGVLGEGSNGAFHQQIGRENKDCEEWVDLVEQTVVALENDVARKLNQIKLLLQQIKTSIQNPPPPPPPQQQQQQPQHHNGMASSSSSSLHPPKTSSFSLHGTSQRDTSAHHQHNHHLYHHHQQQITGSYSAPESNKRMNLDPSESAPPSRRNKRLKMNE